METKVKLFGHPIHPILIVFPLGLLSASVLFDIIYLVTDNPVFAEVAYWVIAIGVLGGLVAAVFGVIDWLSIPRGTRANTIGLYHGLVNGAVTLLFAISWFVRRGDVGHAPSILALILSFLGIGLALVGGWLGGELVYRLRVAVDDGANLDAPSSLSGKPAPATQPKVRRS